MKRIIFVVIALFALITPAAAQSTTEKPQLRMTAAQVQECMKSVECLKTIAASNVDIMADAPAPQPAVPQTTPAPQDPRSSTLGLGLPNPNSIPPRTGDGLPRFGNNGSTLGLGLPNPYSLTSMGQGVYQPGLGVGGGMFLDLAYEHQQRWLQNIWGTAKIKIKGRRNRKDESFLERVNVVALVRGKDDQLYQFTIIDAAEGNNKWDQDITVPIGTDQSVSLIFVHEVPGDIKPAFGRQNLWLQPRAVKSTATPVIVQEEMFEVARAQYDMRTHRYEETANGEIVRKP